MIPTPLPGQQIAPASASGTSAPQAPAGADLNGFLRLVTAASGVARPGAAGVPVPGGAEPVPPVAPQAQTTTVAEGSPLPSATMTGGSGDGAPLIPGVSVTPDGQETAILGTISGPGTGQLEITAKTLHIQSVSGSSPERHPKGDGGPLKAPVPQNVGILPVASALQDRSSPVPGLAPPGVATGPVSSPDGLTPDVGRIGPSPLTADTVLSGTALTGPTENDPPLAMIPGTGPVTGPAPSAPAFRTAETAQIVVLSPLRDAGETGPDPDLGGFETATVPAAASGPVPAVSNPVSLIGAGGTEITGSAPDRRGPVPVDRTTGAPLVIRSDLAPASPVPTGTPGLTPAAAGPAPGPDAVNSFNGLTPVPATTPSPGALTGPGPVSPGPEGAEAGTPVRRLAMIDPVSGSVLPTWSRQTGPATVPPVPIGPAETSAPRAAGPSGPTGAPVAASPVIVAEVRGGPSALMTDGTDPRGPLAASPAPLRASLIRPGETGAGETRTGPGPASPVSGASLPTAPLLTEAGGQPRPLSPAPVIAVPVAVAQPAATPSPGPVGQGAAVPPPLSGAPGVTPAARSGVRPAADLAGPGRTVLIGPGLTGTAPDGETAPTPPQPGIPVRALGASALADQARAVTGSDPAGMMAGPANAPGAATLPNAVIGPERAFLDPSLARPEAPLAPTGTGAAPQTGPAEPGAPLSALLADRTALARHVSRQLRPPAPGEVRTQITLRPDGLGAVEVELSTDQNGRLSLLLRVENPTVLQAIRADRDLLLSGLERSGLELDGAQLGFEGFGAGGEPEREPRRGGPYRPGSPLIPDGPDRTPARHRHTPLIGGGRLDLLT